MTVTLSLPPDVEQAYVAEAQAQGVPLDALVREVLMAGQPVRAGGITAMVIKLYDGMWALRSGVSIPADTVNETLDALRRERDLTPFGPEIEESGCRRTSAQPAPEGVRRGCCAG